MESMTECRSCQSKDLFSAIDLGYQPIANELTRDSEHTSTYPLNLQVCKNCALGQVTHSITPQQLFNDYRYMSAISTTYREHCITFVDTVLKEIEWQPQDWVLELASNDGFLIKQFGVRGITAVGVEPAINIASKIQGENVRVIPKFFSSALAKELVNELGHPKLVIANNVLAHVPDLNDFVSGISILMDHKSLASVENPTLLNILTKNQFDSIYHEHFSYLSANSMEHILRRHELQLTSIDQLETHGGSNRYWIRKANSVSGDSIVQIIKSEIDAGIIDENKWIIAKERVDISTQKLLIFLQKEKFAGKITAGYGAAAKASTLLNYAGITDQFIECIFDASREKSNRYIPNTGIRILPAEKLEDFKIDNFVVFPWNIAEEVRIFLRSKGFSRSRIYKAIPDLEEIT
jgi:hypothetical protein